MVIINFKIKESYLIDLISWVLIFYVEFYFKKSLYFYLDILQNIQFKYSYIKQIISIDIILKNPKNNV